MYSENEQVAFSPPDAPIPCGATVVHLTLSADIMEGLYVSEVKSEFKS